jgi:hypothetical protein
MLLGSLGGKPSTRAFSLIVRLVLPMRMAMRWTGSCCTQRQRSFASSSAVHLRKSGSLGIAAANATQVFGVPANQITARQLIARHDMRRTRLGLDAARAFLLGATARSSKAAVETHRKKGRAMRPVRKWRSAVLGGVETERFINNAKLARSVPAMGRDDFTLSKYPLNGSSLPSTRASLGIERISSSRARRGSRYAIRSRRHICGLSMARLDG